MSEPVFVIVGASLAGGRAAEALRAQGFGGRVILVGEEAERPYDRPPLSKEYLQGKCPKERLYLRPASFYEEQGIEQWYGRRATALDAPQHLLTLDDGSTIRYDKLLIATGGSPRRLNLPGGDLEGIHYLRTLEDSQRLRQEVESAHRAVVVGAGFIGSEVAASCRQRGLEVTILEALPAPLSRALGDEVGRMVGAIHGDHGVALRCGVTITGFRGRQRVEGVELADGEVLPCDFVAVGIGIVPRVEFLEGSGVPLENGVVVDDRCASVTEGVYAAGDVANWWHPTLNCRLRVEHWDNAQNQGTHAAGAMLGKAEPYAPVPFFWSDQYDLNIQYVGHGSPMHEIVVRGNPEERSFSVFFLDGGRVRAALTMNRPRDLAAARRLIPSGTPVTAEQIRDESVDLRRLARGG